MIRQPTHLITIPPGVNAQLFIAAQQGNVEAQAQLGQFCYERKDYASALQWCLRAANANNPAAQNRLGSLLQQGLGCAVDYHNAFAWYSKAAALGHPAAQFNLATMFKRGQGVPVDFAKAAEWFAKAAARGDQDAVKELNNLTHSHPSVVAVPVPHSQPTASPHTPLPAQHHNHTSLARINTVATAPLRLPPGCKYHCMISYSWSQKPVVMEIHKFLETNGLTVWRDDDQMTGDTVDRMVEGISNSHIVLVHMSAAYETSHNCQKELDFSISERKKVIPVRMDSGPYPKTKFKTGSDAVLYFDMCGWESNPTSKSEVLYHLLNEIRRSLGEEPVSAHSSLSSPGTFGSVGIDTDLQENAEKGDKSAQHRLAERYFNGTGGAPKDKKLAFHWFSKAAQQGHSDAQVTLGCMYRDGDGVEKDYQSAMEWFTVAASTYNLNALNNLGLMHSKGWGTPVDFGKAFRYYSMAADRGNAFAQNNVGAYFKDGKAVSQNYEKAVENFEKSANQGNAYGLFNLGCMYRDGLGVAQSNFLAKDLFEKSLAAGHSPAADALNQLQFSSY